MKNVLIPKLRELVLLQEEDPESYLIHDFTENLKKFYNEAQIEDISEKDWIDHINIIKKKYRSKEFKQLFDKRNLPEKDLEEAIEDLWISEGTMRDFLVHKKSVNGASRDLFAVYLNIEGWETFEEKYISLKIKSQVQSHLRSVPKSGTGDDQHTVVTSQDSLFQDIHITGAKIINEKFLSEIGKMYFTRARFYLSKHDQNCQWYGAINGYDIPRDGYHKIKEIALNCFEPERSEPNNIVAVIHGATGCGKSTILKRLACELSHQQEFQTIWIDRYSYKDFIRSGLEEIRKYEHINFLAVIDDWYRINDQEFLEDISSCDNIRLIISDRTTEHKEYINQVNESSIFYLSSAENEKIIKEIIKTKHATWADAAEEIFTEKERYQSSLFLLLYVIAQMDKANFHKDSNDLSNLETTFKKLVSGDIKIIVRKFPSLAQALYYCACIYSEYRINISYKTFLDIADSLDVKNPVSKYFSLLERKSVYHEKLRDYVHINTEGRMKFNHDIIAELGLSKIQLLDWQFNDIEKIRLLDIITDGDDNYSSSCFLAAVLSSERNLFSQEELLSYVDKLIGKRNSDTTYVKALSGRLTPSLLLYYAQKLWEVEIYDTNFFLVASKANEQSQLARKVWSLDHYKKFDLRQLMLHMDFWSQTTYVKKFVEEVLTQDDLGGTNSRLIAKCLMVCENMELKQKYFERDPLDDKEWREICLSGIEISSWMFVKEIAHHVLTAKNWKLFGTYAVCTSFHYMHDKSIGEDFIKSVLTDWKNTDREIVSACIVHFQESISKQNFIRDLLSKWREADERILCSCILACDDKAVEQKFLSEVLNDKNWKFVNRSSVALTIKRKKQTGVSFLNARWADLYLQNFKERRKH